MSDTRAASTRLQLSGGGQSPWMKWTTNHAMAFQPTAMMPVIDPQDGLEYVFMGDENGNVFRLEADPNRNATYDMEWVTKLFSLPSEAQFYNINGYIKYRKNVAATVTLQMEYAGESVFNEAITLEIPAPTGETVWGGDSYWGGDFYFGTAFAGRLTRQKFGIAGQSNEAQLRITTTGSGPVEINEIGLSFPLS